MSENELPAKGLHLFDDYPEDTFKHVKVVRWDGDFWLLSPDKKYMIPVGHARIGREISDGQHGGDITLDEVEDVQELLNSYVLQELANVRPPVKTRAELEEHEEW